MAMSVAQASIPTVSSTSAEANIPDKYQMIGFIGNGSFGKVYKVIRKGDNKVLVWKEINYGQMSDKEKELLVSEVNILKSLRNPFIVKYYDRIIDRDQKKIYIVMEYCPCGDLSALIKSYFKEGKTFEEDVIWRMLAQLALGINDCHNRKEGKIIHRDLKPGNIFLESIFNVKLGDFGLARILSEHSNFATTNVGTPFYMSPEQIEEAGYNEKSDIWSLGCVIYELCNLHPPFQAANHLQLAMKIKEGNYKPVSAKYSSDLRAALDRMLTVDVSKRISVDDILKLSHVSVRIREIRLQQQYSIFKKKEEELKEREHTIEKREKQLTLREAEVAAREKRLIDECKIAPFGNNNNNKPKNFLANDKLKAPDQENKENMVIFKNFKVV